MTAMTITPATVTITGVEFRTRTRDGVLQVLDACGKCGGRGDVGYGNYTYTVKRAGVITSERTCWTCSGAGGTWLTYDAMVKRINDRAKRRAAAERKEAAKLAAAQAELTAWIAVQDATVIAGINAATYGLLLQFVDQIKFRPLSDRQLEVATKIVREQAEKVAAAQVVNVAALAVGHLGTVGARLTVEVEVTNVRDFDGDYGTRYLVTMVTAEGHVLTTWTTGAFGRNAEKGDKATIKGTVKKHGEYQGVPQTELTRVALSA